MKHLLQYKVKGAALAYALLVLFIAVLIGTGLTLLYGFEKRTELGVDWDYSVRQNVDSGIELLMVSDSYEFEDWVEMDLFDNETDSVELKSMNWGVFKIALSKAKRRKKHAQKAVLYGSSTRFDHSLYLAEMNQVVSLGGQSRLSGRLFLPSKGLKRSNVDKQNYTGAKLFYGSLKKSERQLPQFDKREFEKRFFIEEHENDSLVYTNQLVSDSIRRSFFKETVVIESSYDLNIQDTYLGGNVKILADGNVYINAESSLNNVIIYCEQLHIEEGFKGSFQVFARDSVFIENNVVLNYPSIIYAKAPNNQQGPYVSIGEEGVFSGEIVAYQALLKRDNWPLISLEEKSICQGKVFCNGFFELKGVLAGSATALKGLYRGVSGKYENTFVNVTIDPSLIKSDFILAFDAQKTSEIICPLE